MEPSFYRQILDALSDGIYFVDKERRITFWNKGAERLTGYSADEVLGRSCADNLLRGVDDNGRELCTSGCPLEAVIRDGRMREADVYLHHKFGYRIPIHVKATPLRGAGDEILGAVQIFNKRTQNISILKEIETLRKEVLTDPLTQVGNRRFGEIQLQECERTLKEFGAIFGVLIADIDHFKRINDTFGHGVGDKVLRMVAQGLSNGVRVFDSVCRWGGEEFLIIARGLKVEGLFSLAERLRMLVESSWIEHLDQKISVTISLGGSISRKGEPVSNLLNRADTQLYRSKQEGRNRVSIDEGFNPPPPTI